MSYHQYRSRSPLRGRNSHEDMGMSFNSSQRIEEAKYVLFISNIPNSWDDMQLKNFILDLTRSDYVRETMGYIKILKNSSNEPTGRCMINFSDEKVCDMIQNDLTGIELQGKTLHATRKPGHQFWRFDNPVRNRDGVPSINPTSHHEKQQGPPKTQDVELYGLSKDFLKSLDIEPPLSNAIFLSNIDTVKANEVVLRDIFGMAGHVMNVQILRMKDGTPMSNVKIEFDHPVEAVQAISMFYKRELFGKVIFPRLYKYPPPGVKDRIPFGISDIGPGLGPNGTPMRGVRTTIEVQSLRQMINQESSKKQWKEQSGNINQPVKQDLVSMNVHSAVPWTSNQFTQFATVPLGAVQEQILPNVYQPVVIPSFTQNIPVQNVSMQNVPMQNVPMQNVPVQNVPVQNVPVQNVPVQNVPVQNVPVQNVPVQNVPMQNVPMQNLPVQNEWTSQGNQPHYYDPNSNAKREHADSQNRGRGSQVEDESVEESDMLVFSNLPPTVTVDILSAKMREIGDLKLVDIPGRGKAIVRFVHTNAAAHCLKLFNGSKVDGQVINVKYF